MEETNAFSHLNQFIMQQQNAISPTKTPQLNEKLLELIRANLLQTSQPITPNIPSNLPSNLPKSLPQLPVMIPQNDTIGDQMLKASPSASSDMSSQDGGDVADRMMMMQQQHPQMHNNTGLQQQQHLNPLQQLSIDSSAANISAGALPSSEQRSASGHCETWAECFTTTKHCEYEALLFSVYVTERSDRKYDGWTYFDCLHRLQSKCRYRVRAKKQDEFFIVEEKCVHNHQAIEPVGQAGSHAGLPKTIREIVDRSYNENWTLEARTVRVEEEIKRLGLPENPRLGRQIDNRVAYLRRVKNLSETRRIQDQVNGPSIQDPDQLSEALYNPAIMQALIDQNGGRLTVGQGVVEQLFGQQNIADLVSGPSTQVSSSGDIETSSSENIKGTEPLVKPMAINPTPEFYQYLQQQQKLNQIAVSSQENIQASPLNVNGGITNIPQ